MNPPSPMRKPGKETSGPDQLLAESKSMLDMIEAAGRPPDNMDIYAV